MNTGIRPRTSRNLARALILIPIIIFTVLAYGLSTDRSDFHAELDRTAQVPWTAVPHVHDPDFHFTIFGDRTGMAYPGGMERAIRYVNQELANRNQAPEFVLSVGDNIEGYSRDAAETTFMWNGLDALLQQLRIPFFRLPGNHDISDRVMDQVYKKRYGRPYYAFLVENVLFLMLDTEDEPPFLTSDGELKIHKLLTRITREGALHPEIPVQLPGQKDPCDVQETHGELGPLAETHISDEQVNYFSKVLAEYRDARQVVVLMHRPAWRSPRSAAFERIQRMLRGRMYTVFAGHFHQYSHEVLDGADYYILGPTAALPRCVRSRDYLNQLVEVQVIGNHLSVERVMLDHHDVTDLKDVKEKTQ